MKVHRYNFWKTVRLPPHDRYAWAVCEKRTLRFDVGLVEVNRVIDQWLPQKPILIGVPRAKTFVPPICIPQFRAQIHRNIVRNSRTMILAWTGLAITFLLLGIKVRALDAITIGLNFALIATIIFTDQRQCLRHENIIVERALFFFWLFTSSRVRMGLMAWVAIGCFVGVAQLLSQHFVGGLETLFEVSGVVYASVHAGEWWRFLPGPFLHYSLAHYLANASMLILIGSLAWALRGGQSVVAFCLGNVVASFTQYLWGGRLFDSCGGISGGIFALFGFVVALGMVDKRALPRGIGIQVAAAAVSGGVISELLIPSAASTAHVGGALTGVIVGFYSYLCGLYSEKKLSGTKPGRSLEIS